MELSWSGRLQAWADQSAALATSGCGCPGQVLASQLSHSIIFCYILFQLWSSYLSKGKQVKVKFIYIAPQLPHMSPQRAMRHRQGRCSVWAAA